MFGVVTTPRLNVRLQPDKNGTKIGVVSEGTVLDVLARRNGWLEISYQNHSAFVFDDYVDVRDSLPARNGVVRATLLNVRERPMPTARVLGKLVNGAQVEILSDQNGWLEIPFFNSTAFVARKFVDLHDKTGVLYGVVTADRLSVRTTPEIGTNLLGVVLRGTELVIAAKLGEWYQTTFNDQTAYVCCDYIKLIEKEVETPMPVTLNELTEPATPSASIAREAQDRSSDLAPQRLLLVAGTPTERKVASAWNSFGGLLEQLSGEKNIDVGCAVAVLCVESSGKGFEPANENKMIIRFENHKFWKYWGRQNPDIFNQHFKYQQGEPWKGHQWRKDPTGNWLAFHGNQQAEWEVLTFARNLDNDAALFSISMGAPQIMGFNYQAIGYASVQDMFDAFESGIEPHITGLFDFMSPAMVKNLQARDFEGFAGLYNGSGQKEKYGAWIKDHYDAYKRLA